MRPNPILVDTYIFTHAFIVYNFRAHSVLYSNWSVIFDADKAQAIVKQQHTENNCIVFYIDDEREEKIATTHTFISTNAVFAFS